jgi:hypothetical protein
MVTEYERIDIEVTLDEEIESVKEAELSHKKKLFVGLTFLITCIVGILAYGSLTFF